MSLLRRKFYPSDSIAIMQGVNGSESKNSLKWHKRFSQKFPSRICIAINQYYPEFRSAYYFNKNIIKLIQSSLLKIDVFIIIEDLYQLEGPVPIEPLGSLEFADDYLLVDNDLYILGRLRVWESLGGDDSFYHDNVILELITVNHLRESLVKSIHQECVLNNVLCKMHLRASQ